MPFAPRHRAVLASIVAVVGAIAFGVQVIDKRGGWIPVTAVIVAAIALLVPRLFAQLLARGLFWSNLVLGALICVLGGRSSMEYGVPILLACGAALLLGERRALAEASIARGERPAAFAGTLELLMMLALADAQTFAFFAVIDGHNHGATGFFLVAAFALLVGFVGHYRLSLWGVAVTMSTSALFAIGMLLGVVHTDRELFVPILLLLGLQLVVPLPMIASLATRRPLAAPHRRTRAVVGSLVVVGVVLVSLVVGVSQR